MTLSNGCDSIDFAESFRSGVNVKRFLMFALVAVTLSSAGMASTKVATKPGTAWKHDATGLMLPSNLVGLERQSVVFFSAPDVDVASDYWSSDGNDEVTVYLYGNVSGNVPVWFDRSRYFITNLPDKYGQVGPLGIRPYTPRGQSNASGLIESYAVGKGVRSSTLIILPFNGFYAKIRASSKTRDVASIENLAVAAANSFDWSSKLPTIAATPISDCATTLPPAAASQGSRDDQRRQDSRGDHRGLHGDRLGR